MQSSMQAQIKQIFDSLAIFDGRDQQPRPIIQLARFRELCPHCKLPKGHPWSTYRAPIRSRLQTWLSGALSGCISCSVIIAGVHVLSMFEPCKSDDLISAESSLTPGLMTLRNYSHSYPNFNLVLYGQEVRIPQLSIAPNILYSILLSTLRFSSCNLFFCIFT